MVIAAPIPTVAGARAPATSRQFSQKLRGEVRRRNGTWMVRAEQSGGGEDAGEDGDADFEARLARLQRRLPGKKAELRKARKEGGADVSSKAKKDSVFIPPVSLNEPVSDGMVVELGFTPYTERLNGRLAALGLTAVLLVELATGNSFIRFHDSGTLFVQVYTVLALTAIFVKYEKERISVWPKS